MAWLNLTMSNQTVKNGLEARSNCPKWFFSPKTTNEIFMYLFAPFILEIFKKIIRGQSRVMRMCHFRAQNSPFVKNNFFGTNHYNYFHLLIGPLNCAKFKKILPVDPELWGCAIFGPKMYLLVKYWQLKNTEIWLAKSHFWL